MNDKLILCEKCNDEYSVFGYSSHYKKCNGISKKRETSPVLSNGKTQRWLDAMNARRNKGTNQYTKAKELGLDKPELSDTTRNLLRKGGKNRIWDDASRKIMSDHAIRRAIGGKFINGRYEYNGESFASSYEIHVVKSLDANMIKWNKCKKTFHYVGPDGKTRTYLPDLYLPDFDIYLDPKNDFLINNPNPSLGFNDCEKIKIVEKTHNIKVFILDKNQLSWDSISEMINFYKQPHG